MQMIRSIKKGQEKYSYILIELGLENES